MSDQPEQPAAPETGEPSVSAAPEPVSSPPRYREVAIALAGALLLVVALVGTAPFWAASLPWSPAPASGEAGLHRLEQRIGALEAKPAAPAADLGEMRQQIAKLSAATADLATRVDRLDKAIQAQPPGDMAGKLDALDKALRAQAGTTAELASQVARLEKATQSRAANDMTDIGLVLALLQIHRAVEAGRPFAAEYDALAALARARPDIASAAAPLAGPAKTGVGGRAVLANRLRELAGTIANASAPATAAGGEPGWADSALARLRGLVTIRRVGDAAPRDGPEAAVNAAQRAMAGGDLAGAVAALETLAGAPAEAAAAWLRMARERLAVEAALQRVETLLVARLGNATSSPGSPG